MRTTNVRFAAISCLMVPSLLAVSGLANEVQDAAFFESKIRPLLIKRCYECHSEDAQTSEGGLLLDRRSGWLQGGGRGKAVVPGVPEASLLIELIRSNGEMQMPPDEPLETAEVALLVEWVRRGAPGPRKDLGETEFSRLGDQDYLFGKSDEHWSFRPLTTEKPPASESRDWNELSIDRFVYAALKENGLEPSPAAPARTVMRRLSYDLTGLPPTAEQVDAYETAILSDREAATSQWIDELIESPAFGEHLARMWLDVARYADTDSFYRPDTRTPHYFPFAFTYRDYVIASFNADKPYDQFIKEQLAADLMGYASDAPELAALGFLTVGPHANRSPLEAVDDWIDVTTRGLMGLTAACARCHDHKYEPIPTADYYALHGTFSSVIRVHPFDEQKQPVMLGYDVAEADRADYLEKRAAIDAKLAKASGKKAKNNNRSVSQKIRETELAELLLFHAGAPVHAMVVREKPRPVNPVILVRGDLSNRGDRVARRFLTVLDPAQEEFPEESSGRLQLAEKIVDPSNPLTARVYVNRVWGWLMGSHLVSTPSDFGLQGTPPTHPRLLDWLAHDFIENGGSTKRLVRQIVASRTYQQSSANREGPESADPLNSLLWRANRKRLSFEALRDSLLAASGQLEQRHFGRAERLWGEGYSKRRTIYGFINRFNLDPTLRAFDFPTPMQTQPGRGESIVAPQALFTMNSPFVIERATATTESEAFKHCLSDHERIAELYSKIYQRQPERMEIVRIERFLEHQKKFTKRKRSVSPWAVLAQALFMSNEFQYID